jgi:hypothetical protein
MISAAEVTAFYGAALATFLAVVQYRQWLRGQVGLSVIASKEFSAPPEHLEVMITNTVQSKVFIDFCGVGYGYRPWLKPWAKRFETLHSMKGVEGDHLSGKAAGGWLAPGEVMEVYFDREAFGRLNAPVPVRGFGTRLHVCVDHSRSDRALCKVIG